MNILKTIPIKYQFLFVIVAVIICYHSIIQAPFLWDDEVMVTGNHFIKENLSVSKIFTHGAFGETLANSRFYRPLQILSYALDYQLWGLNSLGFHLTNILIHILTCAILLLLLKSLSIKNSLVFLVTLIYSIHPINIENVTYISGRGDLLCTFFSLLSIFSFILVTQNKKPLLWFVVTIITYGLALLSKENTILLPLLLLWLFIWKWQSVTNKRLTFSLLAVLFILLGLYLVLRYTYTLNIETQSLSIIAHASLVQRISTLPVVIIAYIRLLIIPYNYHMEYHFVANTIFNIGSIFFILICTGLYFVVRKKWINKKEFIFYLLWIFVTLAPISNVLIPLPSTLREHWISFAVVPFFLILGQITQKICIKEGCKKVLLFISFLWILYIGFYTYQRNKDWTEALRLYKHDAALAPNSFLLWNNLGVEYFRKGQKTSAEECFEKSKQVCPEPGYAPTYNNLAVCKSNDGDYETAILYYSKAIELDEYLLSYQNLSSMLIQLQRDAEALSILKKGALIYPEDAEIFYLLSIGYYNTGNYNDALNTLYHLKRINPSYKNTDALIKEVEIKLKEKN